jgi:hypothetical protein
MHSSAHAWPVITAVRQMGYARSGELLIPPIIVSGHPSISADDLIFIPGCRRFQMVYSYRSTPRFDSLLSGSLSFPSVRDPFLIWARSQPKDGVHNALGLFCLIVGNRVPEAVLSRHWPYPALRCCALFGFGSDRHFTSPT